MRNTSVRCAGLICAAMTAGVLTLVPAANVWAEETTVSTQSWQEVYDTIRSITDTPAMQLGNSVQSSYQMVDNGPVEITNPDAIAGNVIYQDTDGNAINASTKNSSSGKVKVTSSSSSSRLSTSTTLGKLSSTVSTLSTLSDNGKSYSSSDTKSGPGSSTSELRMEDNYRVDGPQVENVTLSETYHEDYGVYSESIEGYYYFYTNVGNNGITDQPVSVDLPANITYTVEKDGITIPYTSKQTVSETGTYMFRITAVQNSEKPLAEQVIYNTTYVFRIQPKLPSATAAAQDSRSDSYYTSDYYSNALNARDDIMASTYRPQDFLDTETQTETETLDYLFTEETTEAETEAEPEESTVETTEAETEAKTEAETETAEAAEEETEGEEAVLADGVLECTITETSDGVIISYDPDEVETIILSNGKRQETYTSLTEIHTPGNYTMYLYDAKGNVREYHFRVKRHINAASVLSILLVIAIIAVGVVFYRRTKNDMNLK